MGLPRRWGLSRRRWRDRLRPSGPGGSCWGSGRGLGTRPPLGEDVRWGHVLRTFLGRALTVVTPFAKGFGKFDVAVDRHVSGVAQMDTGATGAQMGLVPLDDRVDPPRVPDDLAGLDVVCGDIRTLETRCQYA